MGCEHLERRADGEFYSRPKNMRCIEVPGSECEELYRAQKKGAEKDEGETE